MLLVIVESDSKSKSGAAAVAGVEAAVVEEEECPSILNGFCEDSLDFFRRTRMSFSKRLISPSCVSAKNLVKMIIIASALC